MRLALRVACPDSRESVPVEVCRRKCEHFSHLDVAGDEVVCELEERKGSGKPT